MKHLITLIGSVLLVACHASSHPTSAAHLGQSRPARTLHDLVSEPGPIEVTTVESATWQVPREGMINLDHPRARHAHLESGPEPIAIYFHALKHPTRGLFVVDTGVERRFRDAPEKTSLSWIVRAAVDLESLDVKEPLGDYLAKRDEPLRGVLLTHLHLDHVMGLRDVPVGVPIYVGPGETHDTRWENMFSRSAIDGNLLGKGALLEFQFDPNPNSSFDGVLDVFGDGSLWALWVPGHSPGSVAYLARTPDGPVLMTGDASHTCWGWEHGVEPGEFSTDLEESARSLAKLRMFVEAHPEIDVRLGHQG